MHATRNAPAAVALLLVLAAMPVLGGCSLRVIDPADDAGRSPAATTSPDGGDVAPVDPVVPSGEETPPASSALSTQGQAQRDALLAAADTTMTCPEGPLTADGDIVRVEGSCARLVVDLDVGAVIADDVENLTVNGSGTTVFVENVKTITVTGSTSDIFWTGSTPEVTDTGAANTVKHG